MASAGRPGRAVKRWLPAARIDFDHEPARFSRAGVGPPSRRAGDRLRWLGPD